ncbi:MAG TPA: UvrD-helicase domain-containing protein [Solirubrobacterales bacterium]|nr:UvrD-helicase domain-containing protein [Solirubrobacterales bacterium]
MSTAAAAATREPTPEQRAAIDARDRDVFLEAGAGTGKTGVLVDRYCAAIEVDEATPESILAITFTDRAAAQLRARVRAELDRRSRAASEAGDAALAEHLATAVSGLSAGWITTIHGFCRRLLASHPVAAGLDPRFGVLDAPAAERTATAAFNDVLEEFLAGGDPVRETTVAAYRPDGLRDLVTGAHAELRSRGELRPRLPDPPTTDLPSSLDELEAAAEEALAQAGPVASQRAVIEEALALARSRATRLPSVDELAAVCRKWKPEGLARFCAAAAVARSRAAEVDGGLAAYEHVRELLELFDRRYEEAKAARASLDFEDLQLLAVALLTESEPLRQAYGERFTHLMVDEFQDTNRLQLRLVEALTGPATRRFVVGDEYQSIYGFRHADLDVFRGERTRLRGEAAGDRPADVLGLSGNFRARPELIAATNAIGASLLASAHPQGFRPLTAGAPPAEPDPRGGAPSVELLITRGKWDADEIDLALRVDDTTPKATVAEARFLAARLSRLAEAGVPRGDMVVLLRAFSHVDAFEEALDRAGLRPYVVGGRGYWSRQQAQDMLCLLSVIANPRDEEPLFGALASPAGGVGPETLWLLRRAGGSGGLWTAAQKAGGVWPEADVEQPELLERIEPGQRERLASFCAIVLLLREAAPRVALEELIDRAVRETGYDLAILQQHLGTERLANVRQMMRLAREFEDAEGRDLRGFIDYARARAEAGDDPIAATAEEDHDGVRVMTIHTAKGLEFPVVAVADLGRGLIQGGFPPALRLGPGRPPAVGMRLARMGAESAPLFEMERLRRMAEERDIAEELRLFYVGATRAEERLLLSGVMSGNGSARRPVIARLPAAFGIDEVEDGATSTVPPPEPRPGLGAGFAPAEVLTRVNDQSPERAAELVRSAGRQRPEVPTSTGAPPLLEHSDPAPALPALSYSALAEYERCGYRFHTERVLGLKAAGAGGPGALAFGSAVHALLEWSARNRWVEPKEDFARRRLAGAGLDPDRTLERALAQVSGWLASPLCAELRAMPSVRPEAPFLLALRGQLVRGSIDMLGSGPGLTPLVIDFKTDRLEGADPAEAAGRYELQRLLYALATAEATGSERVRVAWVFLERPQEAAQAELGPEDVAAGRARLEETVARAAAGEFEVTATPTWELCRDCPARRRLCSNPARPPATAAA